MTDVWQGSQLVSVIFAKFSKLWKLHFYLKTYSPNHTKLIYKNLEEKSATLKQIRQLIFLYPVSLKANNSIQTSSNFDCQKIWIVYFACIYHSLSHSLTHSTHSLTPSLPPSLAHSLTQVSSGFWSEVNRKEAPFSKKYFMIMLPKLFLLASRERSKCSHGAL